MVIRDDEDDDDGDNDNVPDHNKSQITGSLVLPDDGDSDAVVVIAFAAPENSKIIFGVELDLF